MKDSRSTILGIETSCDETSAAIIQGEGNSVIVKANIVASSSALHAQTGGIIPEVAARQQLRVMLPVIEEAFKKAGISSSSRENSVDAIAVTYGPGLIGSLLVGVETAKTLAYVWNKPIVPVNHMLGHVYANFIRVISNFSAKGGSASGGQFPISNKPMPEFPILALVVSGGHTDLLLMKQHGDVRVLGGTRDDAAGEAFDKVGRLLGFSYPAGPVIEERAKSGNIKRFRFPRPLIDSKDFDFSFSGLKTAVLREVKSIQTLDEQTVNDISAATQEAVVDVLVRKTLQAAESFTVKSIVLSGGVAANQLLRERFQSGIERRNITAKLYYPPKILCTDNAAMIAAAAYFNYHPVNWQEITADPELYYT